MKNVTIILLALFVLAGCNPKQTDLECLTLSVDLHQSTLQFEDVFSHAEVIPLETTENSFIVYPMEIVEHKGYLYIYDIHTVKAFIFDEKGKFIRQVSREGQGPGEYSWLASIQVDKKNDVLHLVEPVGKIHNFTLEGEFIETKRYLDGNDYQCLHHLGDYFISWSHPNNSQTDCIIVFDANTMEIVNTYDRGPQLLQEGNFYSYSEDLFFFKHQENRVYTVTKDSLSLAYRWDFGKDNLKMNHLGLSYDDDNYRIENELHLKYMKDGTIPYIIISQSQNDNYYYACLRHQYKYDKNLIYRKSDGKYLVFGEKSWHMPTNAHVFTDNHMIITLNPNNYDNVKPFLSEAERKKLDALTEDDNPCLLKLHFKK